MRVTKTQAAATVNTGLAQTMKLVIAVVFVCTIALLNITQRPALQPATVNVTEQAEALAPATEPQQATETAQDAPADATPQPKPFDAKDPTTWPKCAADEIVRADNGQCSKAATPVQTATAAPTAPAVTGNDAKAFIYEHESGNSPCKINGGAIDCNYTGSRACGLGQALPCSKLTAVCSLADYACQDAWFTNYMQQRYGTWENARAFWLANRWW